MASLGKLRWFREVGPVNQLDRMSEPTTPDAEGLPSVLLFIELLIHGFNYRARPSYLNLHPA